MSSRWVGGLVAVLFSVAVSAPAAADTYEPTRLDDPVPNGCKANDCSLREAVLAANNRPGPDTIPLEAGRYKLEQAGEPGSEDTPRIRDLDLLDSATVKGRGVRQTIVSAEGLDRAFELGVVGRIFRPTHALARMTVRGGAAGNGDGGGVLLQFTDASLKNLVVKRNSAARGGGVASLRGIFSIKRSTLSANVAGPGGGGGVFLPASLNQAKGSITSSTISGNQGSLGGGIYLDGFSEGSEQKPDLDVLNSTVASNQAFVSGGGIAAIQGATIGLDNTTVAYNGADVDSSGGGNGGGLFQSSSAVFELGDALIAGNTVGATGAGQQCAGSYTSLGGVVVQLQPGTACSISGSITEPVDAMIGPLGNNGGPTKTIALLAGSAAIGFAETCPAKDQRGIVRPVTDCDAGAFEHGVEAR